MSFRRATAPDRRVRGRVALRVLFCVCSAIVSASFFAGAPHATALTLASGPVALRVRPVDGLADGEAVAVEASSSTGVLIYQLRAHLCTPGRPVQTNFDFGFQGRRCANVPLGHGDVEQTAEFGAGVNHAALGAFKVGAGSVHWVNELGYDQTEACGPGSPCDLVVRVQITDGTLFFDVPLCYGSACPPEPADRGALVPPPSTTTTTVHPAMPTTVPTSAPVTSGPKARAGRGATRAGTATPTTTAGLRPRRALAPAVLASRPARAAAAGPPKALGGERTSPSRWRLAFAALAGALGGAWIFSIFARGTGVIAPLVVRARRRAPVLGGAR